MTVPPDVFETLPARPYGEVRGLVRDGDILLCSATNMGSWAIRWATRSIWSHVAIAFRLPAIDRVLVLECVENIGVRAVPLSDFITRTSSGKTPYPGRILLARHQALAERSEPETMRRMTGFAFDRLGDKFSNAETMKIGLRIALGRLNLKLGSRLQPDDEYVCSEYVANCFAAVDLRIAWDGLGFVAPSDIAADAAVVPAAHLLLTEKVRDRRD